MAYVSPKICPVIGIDLGTTNSCVGVWREQRYARVVDIVANASNGQRITPSVVYFPANPKQVQEPVVGEAARQMIVTQPASCLYDMKRLVGKDFDDPMVAKLGKQFKLVRDPATDSPLVEVNTGVGEAKRMRPLDVSSLVLKRMKEIATDALNSNSAAPVHVEKAVVCVPAHFTQRQKSETMEAARLAGMEPTLITEPVAAAYAYGCYHEQYDDLLLLVFDLGGGTFDTSVIKVEKGEFHVKALGGDAELGGRDFDLALLDHCRAEMLRLHAWDCCGTPADRQRMLLKCEDAKKALSAHLSVDVQFGDMCAKMTNKPLRVTRASFEALIAPMVNHAMRKVDETLAEADLGGDGNAKSAIKEVLLVGGSTCIPLVQKELSALFGGTKQLNKSLNGDEVVAYGAAVRAAQLWGKAGNSLPPLSIFDMTALSIGVGLARSCYEVMIPRRSPVPTTVTKVYTTTRNGQAAVGACIYEGERRLSTDNIFLKEVVIRNLRHARAGDIYVGFTLHLNASGQLEVSLAEQNRRDNAVSVLLNYAAMAAKGQSVEDMLAAAKLHEVADCRLAARAMALSSFECDIERAEWDVPANPSARTAMHNACAKSCAIYRAWIKNNEQNASLDEIRVMHKRFRDVNNL